MEPKKINVAIIGLGFGAEFIPIYQRHPHANMYAICQRNEQKLNEVGHHFGIEVRYTDYDELLKDPNVDAVHINTPIPDHAAQSIKALKAGKHVACTVPMATSVEDCRQIVELVEQTGLTYMMMETVVYAREFLFMKELYDNGELGKVQFLKASHQQDMDGWPNYWPGLPPMHYATHCVGPVLALTRAEAEYVSCFGSGTIREELHGHYNSPFAVESTHIKFKGSDLSAHVYRSLFDVARQYRESIEVYGSKKSVEWPLIEHKPLVVHTAKKPEPEIPEEVQAPDYAHLLPEPIQRFTTKGVYDTDEQTHLSFVQGAGHGGSHPHLVHEFVSALVEKRAPFPDARQSANITCVGILAHESAMEGGKLIPLPSFTLSKSSATASEVAS
ncbi:Gfo/Idh/MocA family oxidoreductase [Paracnuella aquatica]|uniref:Gfo/Idh/MocA family oxidoreductase n=1 Tax=Paracnuella aquatica TaxID=2268757 RepID=UPI000DEFEE05|nr:Gfo/Idh/MocA family oxidoreductase [Paracnuella aquatica]RPD51322.1 gfo/Idh/MocA family oxidoreductase [Paracnuella aquatica]